MSRPLLACRDLGLRYGERCLLRGLDLAVHAGERWAIVGPNGAGKTSLLLVLAGARRPDAGAVELDGRPLAQWNVQELAALRALVADRWIDAFAMSALDCVLAGRYRLDGAASAGPLARWRAAGATRPAGPGASAEERARGWLRELDCADLAARDVRRLSRGERQRVALAAALAQESALVLLDEPISHQDPRHQMLVLRQLQSCVGRTFIGALHDLNAAARFATHALLLAGDGTWQAGAAHEVLTCAALSALFATPIVQIEIGLHRVFVAEGNAMV
jgi:iron complex transport system ATP-binding protein